MLPQEIIEQSFDWLDEQDVATVRALSQCSRGYDAMMRTKYPERYEDAHVATLTRAFTHKSFKAHNPRNKSVLSGVQRLRLLDGLPGYVRIPPARQVELQPQQIESLAATLPPIQSLTFGRRTRHLGLYWGLLTAGLKTQNLTELFLESCAQVPMHHLDWLHDNLHQVPALQKLTFPSRLSGASQLPRYDLSVLAQLRTFSWAPRSRPAIGEVSLEGNSALEKLVLKFHPDALLVNLPGHLSVRLTMPQAPVRELELATLFILPEPANLFTHAPWQTSLTTLRLGAVIFADVLDLRGFCALQELLLTEEQLDLSRLRLPVGAPLRKLGLRGRNLPAVLQQLHASPIKTLHHLELFMDPLSGSPVQVPWQALPKLQSLVLACFGSQPLYLGRLHLPHDNRLQNLALRGPDRALRPDKTLKEQPLPLMEHLDLCRYRLTQAHVAQLEAALAEPGHWPRLRRLTIMPTGVRQDLRRALSQLAQRYGFTLVQACTPER